MRGQSTLEYVLVLAAVLAAIVVAASQMGTKTQSSLNQAANIVDSATTKLKNGLNLQ